LIIYKKNNAKIVFYVFLLLLLL